MTEIKNAVGRWPALSAATVVVSADMAVIRANEAVVAARCVDRMALDAADRQMLRDMLFGETR